MQDQQQKNSISTYIWGQQNKYRFIDLIQTDSKTFNQSQIKKQKEFKDREGEQEYQKVMWSKTHNPLKSQKSRDYILTNDELLQLDKHKVLIKRQQLRQYKGPTSMGTALYELYSNDMPVFVTSDVMLNALHRFYDQSIEILEENMITKFIDLCQSMLGSLHRIKSNTQSVTDMLKGIQLYLAVPYYLLQNDFKKINPFNEKSQRRQYLNFQRKNPSDQRLQKSRKLEFVPKYCSTEQITSITNKIRENKMQKIIICDVELQFNATTFKPRGHYEKNIKLSNYFMAFTWFAKCVVKLDKSKPDQYKSGLKFAILLSQIAKENLDEVNKIENFVGSLIGEPDGYTLTNFLTEIENYFKNQIQYSQSSSYFFKWLLKTQDQPTEQGLKKKLDRLDIIMENLRLTKSCELTKVGDKFFTVSDISGLTPVSFSLIGKGTTYDNSIINKMVDQIYAKQNDGYERKYPSIFDVTYALFGNPTSVDFLNEGPNGPGHLKYLDSVKLNSDDFKVNSLYDQELVMLKALSNKQKYQPFNSDAWLKKQLQTQIGHYNEIRHDNVLYLEECYGNRMGCEYADIMIEPCLQFWKEFLNLVAKMRNFFTTNINFDSSQQWQKQSKCKQILTNFSSIVKKFIIFTECFLNGKEISQNLKQQLKCILNIERRSSGPTEYSGWYPQLFYKGKESIIHKFQVSSFFTGVPDIRDAGGICHLGNGNPQLMYIVVNNAVYIGPVYEMYSELTPYQVRYNDSEWEKSYSKYKPLNFNS